MSKCICFCMNCCFLNFELIWKTLVKFVIFRPGAVLSYVVNQTKAQKASWQQEHVKGTYFSSSVEAQPAKFVLLVHFFSGRSQVLPPSLLFHLWISPCGFYSDLTAVTYYQGRESTRKENKWQNSFSYFSVDSFLESMLFCMALPCPATIVEFCFP